MGEGEGKGSSTREVTAQRCVDPCSTLPRAESCIRNLRFRVSPVSHNPRNMTLARRVRTRRQDSILVCNARHPGFRYYPSRVRAAPVACARRLPYRGMRTRAAAGPHASRRAGSRPACGGGRCARPACCRGGARAAVTAHYHARALGVGNFAGQTRHLARGTGDPAVPGAREARMARVGRFMGREQRARRPVRRAHATQLDVACNFAAFNRQLERAYRAKSGESLTFEARLVHELWRTLSRVSERSEIRNPPIS